MGKYWFMVLLFLGVTAIGCQGDHTGEDSRAYAEDEAGSEAVNTLVSGSKYRIVTDVMELRGRDPFAGLLARYNAYGGRIRGTDRHIRKYVRLLSGRVPAF